MFSMIYRKCGPGVRRVWRYQRGNQNPYIKEQKTQWPKEKVQKDKQRTTKDTYKMIFVLHSDVLHSFKSWITNKKSL